LFILQSVLVAAAFLKVVLYETAALLFKSLICVHFSPQKEPASRQFISPSKCADITAAGVWSVTARDAWFMDPCAQATEKPSATR
jgi:hypothetical protein